MTSKVGKVKGKRNADAGSDKREHSTPSKMDRESIILDLSSPWAKAAQSLKVSDIVCLITITIKF